MRPLLALLLLSLIPHAGLAQEDVGELWRQGTAAYHAQDYDLFTDKMRQLRTMRPYQAPVRKNLIRAHSLSGNSDQAIALLEELVAEGHYMTFESEDFKNLKQAPAFPELAQRLALNNIPVGQAEVILRIRETDLLPEAVAHHEKSGAYFVGSVRQGRILKVARGGAVTTFAAPTAENQLMGVFGLKIDQARNHLWVTSSQVMQHRGMNQGSGHSAGLFQFDLESGSLLNRYFPDDNEKHLFGDLLLAPDGGIYVSDSLTPVIYKLDSGRLSPYVTSDKFVNLQGLCLSGETLYLADYNTGLYAVDLPSKQISKLNHATGVNVGGIDGLYCHGTDLIGIQNGISPHRIVKLHVENKVIQEVVEINKNLTGWDEPTLGMIRGDSFYYIATSQWSAYDTAGQIAEGAVLRPLLVMKTPLD